MGSCCSTGPKGVRLGGESSEAINQQPSRQDQMADRQAALEAAERRRLVILFH